MLERLIVIIFLLTIFSLPFVSVFNFSVFKQKIQLTEIFFLLGSAVFLFGVFAKKIKFKLEGFYLPLLFYLSALFLSVAFSGAPGVSSVKFLGVIYLAGLAVLAFNVVSDEKILRKTILIWLAATAVAASISVLTFFVFYVDRSNFLLARTLSVYGSLPPGNYPRVQSTFLNPNMFCHYLTISFAFLLTARQLKWIKTSVFFVLLLIFSVAAILTISPSLGGILLLVGCWLGYFFKSVGKEIFSKTSFVLGFLAAAAFFITSVVAVDSAGGEPLRNFWDVKFQTSVRVSVWQSALENFLRNPLTGSGLGTDAAFVIFSAPDGGRQILTDAHQIWLNVAAQAGVPGLLAVSFLGIYLLKRSLPLDFENKKARLRTGLALAFFSVFFYQGLTGSYEDARHLWVLIGMLGAVVEKDFAFSRSSSGL